MAAEKNVLFYPLSKFFTWLLLVRSYVKNIIVIFFFIYFGGIKKREITLRDAMIHWRKFRFNDQSRRYGI